MLTSDEERNSLFAHRCTCRTHDVPPFEGDRDDLKLPWKNSPDGVVEFLSEGCRLLA